MDQTTAVPSTGIEFPSDTVTVTLKLSEVVTVAGTPTLALNSGGTATYFSGSGTDTLTFIYTVGPNDTTVPSLTITAVNLPAGATISDAAGNTADLSGALVTFPDLQIDPPGTPVISSYSTDSGTAGDRVTNDDTLTLTGTATANSTVTVYDGATSLGSTTTMPAVPGALPPPALTAWRSRFYCDGNGVAGNTRRRSAALSVTIDTQCPGHPGDCLVLDRQWHGGDGITNDNTLTLTGSAEANATVKVYDGVTLLGSATADGSGNWSYTTAALTNGAHSLTATATDVAGNTSAASSALSVTIDTTAPVTPAIAAFSTDSGTVGDGITNDNTLTLTGSAEANATVKVYDGATLLGSQPPTEQGPGASPRPRSPTAPTA